MSSLTKNLKLVKPELQDNITPTIFADNFDKIDAALEGVSGGALSLEEIEASTNLDGKIPSAAALKEVNNSLEEYFTPTVLWENPNTRVAQNAQTLTLSDDISNYKYIEYHYLLWIDTDVQKRQYYVSGKLPSDSCCTVLSVANPNGLFLEQ